jgi:mitotic spindle assembly checkpoint protein MAD1
LNVKMDRSDDSATPTALLKIFGDFDSRVRTASRRTFEGMDPIRRHPSRSSTSYKPVLGGLVDKQPSRTISTVAAPRGRLMFDESSAFDSPQQRVNKRPSNFLDDPLVGMDRYPKAMRSEDTKNLQAQIERLKMQLIQKDADYVSLETEVKQGQYTHKKMLVEVAHDRLTRETEREAQIRELRSERERVQDLKNRVQELSQRRAHDEEYAELRNLPRRTPDRSAQDDLNLDNQRLNEEIIQLQEELFAFKADAEGDAAANQDRLTAAQAKNAELEERLQALEQDPEKASGTQIQLERVKDELTVAQQELNKCQNDLKTFEEDRIQQRIMNDRLNKHSGMERELENLCMENKLLNETADNSSLLQEKLQDLTVKLATSEASLAESLKRQESLIFAERKLKQWKSLTWRLLSQPEREQLGDDVGVDIMGAKIAELQQGMLTKSEEIESLKSAMRLKDNEILGEHGKMEEMAAKSATDKLNLTEQANLIKRFKRKLVLVSKERDSYKGVLESYEHEMTFNGNAFEKDRIGALEASLKDYRETVERLEDLLSTARSSNLKESDSEAKLRDEVAGLTSKVRDLERENEALGRSEAVHDEGAKVLHFLDNPLSQATEARHREVEDLKAEVTALKARLQLLEEGQTKDLTMLVGQKVNEDCSEEVRDLQEQLRAAEIRKQRLIEAFKKTSQDFREVCYQLTGFRIDGLNDGKYRLTPVYGESVNDHLLFKREQSGECLLLETQYSAQLTDLIDLHLSGQNSIPVFLAALITDLFSRQTFDTMGVDVSVADENDENEEEQPPQQPLESEDEDQQQEQYVIMDENVGQEDEAVEEEEEIMEEEGEPEESFDESESGEDSNNESDPPAAADHDDDGDDDDIVCID